MLTEIESVAPLRKQRPAFYQMRSTEFARLDRIGATYLDFAGSALYPSSLLQPHTDFLLSNVLGNPHSDSPSARQSTALIENARARVLSFFDADPLEYCVVFTANTSAAVHLVASGFPFEERSNVVLLSDNHNSVNGIREYAAQAGARVRYVPIDKDLRAVNVEHVLKPAPRRAPSLFAFPAQSNFSGVQHPLRLINAAQGRGFHVLLDAAAFVPTHPLSLATVKPDFLAVSFYKMFGYPTGVGALVARRDALATLARPWFAGGTVDFVSVQNGFHRIKEGVEGFEDGTANFAAIAAIPRGLDFLDDIGMDRIDKHVSALTRYALERLRSRPNIVLYGPADVSARGATIAFNVVDHTGAAIPFEDVELRARQHNISIRGGCFCNPGAAERAFDIPPGPARQFMNETGFSIPGFRRFLGGRAVGALRASFGIPTTQADIDRLVSILDAFRR
jgi:selenocysteine lyase/cysteine desulfurase